MSIASKRVLIAGGGFAGFSTAIALIQFAKEKNLAIPSVEIVEAVNSPSDKDFQDYTISIRADSGGVQALKRLKVYDEARTYASVSKGFRIISQNGKTFEKMLDAPTSLQDGGIRPRRVALWNTLRTHLPESVKQTWGLRAVDAKTIPGKNGEEVEVTLSNGETRTVDLLVVADGSRSEIRNKLYPQEKLGFSGMNMIMGYAEMKNTVQEPFFERHSLTPGDNVSLFVAHEKANTLLWGVQWLSDTPHEEIRHRTATEEQREYLRKSALERGASLPKYFVEIVESTPKNTLRVMSTHDKYPHTGKDNIVFIGDSCHPVTPFSGNGANMALVDGVSLAEELTNPAHKTIGAATAAFTKTMIPRCRKVVDEGRQIIKMAHMTSTVGKVCRNTIMKSVGFAIDHPTVVKTAATVVVAGIVGCVAALIIKRQ